LNHLNFEPAEGLSVERVIEIAVCRRAVSVPLQNNMLRMVTSRNRAVQRKVGRTLRRVYTVGAAENAVWKRHHELVAVFLYPTNLEDSYTAAVA